MQIDKDLLLNLAARPAGQSFEMKIDGHVYNTDAIDLVYSETPVSRPTTRGGVYFSDKMGFKIKVKVSDMSLSTILSKTMLGPNTDFAKIQFLTAIEQNGERKHLRIFANLTNYVQRSTELELNLMVIGTDLSD
jgi:hypothetical protein